MKEFCIRELKEAQERESLSPFAMPSGDSRGRLKEEKPCDTRTIFQRDIGRIIYSMDFRRLRHKTQVFFNPRSDHVCTRMEHVIYVSYIAGTIGSALRLNVDLIKAIALGHDLGHAPFGHSGEAELNAILKAQDSPLRFKHEAHSLRVVDLLAEHRNENQGLNLSFEVRDGIVSHCGEKYLEYSLKPNRLKQEKDLVQTGLIHGLPATLEGCVVRISDRIAYLGRDIEDAARAGLMDFADIPKEIRKTLGKTNRDIVNTLVSDIIKNSRDKNEICMSREIAESMSELLQINVRRIYSADKVRKYEFIVRQIIQGLYESFREAIEDKEAMAENKSAEVRKFSEYVSKHPEPQALPERIICDYIAGMTDTYATTCFHNLYQI